MIGLSWEPSNWSQCVLSLDGRCRWFRHSSAVSAVLLPSQLRAHLQTEHKYLNSVCVCISFICTLDTHNKQIIKLHHVTHTHSISADVSLIVKSRREISLFRTRNNSFTNCASRVTSTVLHGWCIACLYT